MVPRFIFPIESLGWRESGGSGGLTRFWTKPVSGGFPAVGPFDLNSARTLLTYGVTKCPDTQIRAYKGVNGLSRLTLNSRNPSVYERR
jgi:hypothetical protein